VDRHSTDPAAAAEAFTAEPVDDAVLERFADRAAELVTGGRLTLLGEGGLLQELTRQILTRAVEAEFQAHLDKAGDSSGHPAVGGNGRSGYRERTVLSEVGPMRVRVPRDRAGTFRSQILPPRLRRLPGLDRLVVSLVARGLTTRELVSHVAEVYGVLISRDTVSRITAGMLADVETWYRRPLDHTYVAIHVDSYDVHVHGEGKRLTIHAALGVDRAGRSEMLGIWAGPEFQDSRSAWTTIGNELSARQVRDVRVIICDSPNGIGAMAGNWPMAIVQPSVPHLLRSSLHEVRPAARAALAAQLHTAATAPSQAEALARLAQAERDWGQQYPQVFQWWRRSLVQLAPLFRLAPEFRALLAAPTPLEGLRARFRRISDHSGYLADRQAVLNRFYLATLAFDPEDGNPSPELWAALYRALPALDR